jgi:hypothetical protein
MRLVLLFTLALLSVAPRAASGQIRISREGSARRISTEARFDGSTPSPPAEATMAGLAAAGGTPATALIPNNSPPLPGTEWAHLDANHPTEPQHARIMGVGLRYSGYPDGGYVFAAAEPPLGSVLIVYITSPAAGTFFLVRCDVEPGEYSVSRHQEGQAPSVQMKVAVGGDRKLSFMLDNAAQGGHGFNLSRDDQQPWDFKGCEVRKLS